MTKWLKFTSPSSSDTFLLFYRLQSLHIRCPQHNLTAWNAGKIRDFRPNLGNNRCTRGSTEHE